MVKSYEQEGDLQPHLVDRTASVLSKIRDRTPYGAFAGSTRCDEHGRDGAPIYPAARRPLGSPECCRNMKASATQTSNCSFIHLRPCGAIESPRGKIRRFEDLKGES